MITGALAYRNFSVIIVQDFSGLIITAGYYHGENIEASLIDSEKKKSKLHWHSFLFPCRDVDVDRRAGVGLQVTILSTIRIVKAKNAVSSRTTFLHGMQLTRLECFPPRGEASQVSRIYGEKQRDYESRIF